MFDVGFFELCIVGIVALLVLGPERLPHAARTAGMWVGRAKRMIAQVKRDIDDELRQEELQELREAKDSLSKTKESMKSFQEDLNQQIDTDDAEKGAAPAPKTPTEPKDSMKSSREKPNRQAATDDREKQAAPASEPAAESGPTERKGG